MDIKTALDGFLLSYASEFSPSSVRVKRACLRVFSDYIGWTREIDDIQLPDLEKFIIYIKTDHIPNRMNKNDDAPISNSGIDNYWKSLRAFFTWNAKTNGGKNPALNLARNTPIDPEIIPFTEAETQKILTAVNTQNYSNRLVKRANRLRDTAIVFTLLDTGLRIGELTRLRMNNIDLENGEISVVPYLSGKKSRGRPVIIGKNSKRALWLYFSKRPDITDYSPVFATRNERTLSDVEIRQMLSEAGKRAGVADCHPHRFRHTFALEYLRNGGDPYTLQKLLGHSDMTMVKRYVAIAKADLIRMHKFASPVDNWHLR